MKKIIIMLIICVFSFCSIACETTAQKTKRLEDAVRSAQQAADKIEQDYNDVKKAVDDYNEAIKKLR